MDKLKQIWNNVWIQGLFTAAAVGAMDAVVDQLMFPPINWDRVVPTALLGAALAVRLYLKRSPRDQ
jgi:hypothetical protein